MSNAIAAGAAGPAYRLRLYVAGTTALSTRAAANMRRICEEFLDCGGCDMKVVNICQHPELAAKFQIFAAPTLVKEFPLPERRFVGDMSRTDLILDGLGVQASARPARVG